MKHDVGISQYVIIRNHTIYFNGDEVMNGKGDIQTFLSEAYKQLGISYIKFFKMDVLSKLGFIASEYLLKNHSLIEVEEYQRGIVLQNRASSLEADHLYQQSIKDIASPALFVYTLPNIVMGEIAIRNHFKGENTFFITEQFNASQLVDYVKLLFDQHFLSLAICGYADVYQGKEDIFLFLLEKNGKYAFDLETLEKLYQIGL